MLYGWKLHFKNKPFTPSSQQILNCYFYYRKSNLILNIKIPFFDSVVNIKIRNYIPPFDDVSCNYSCDHPSLIICLHNWFWIFYKYLTSFDKSSYKLFPASNVQYKELPSRNKDSYGPSSFEQFSDDFVRTLW